MPLIFNLKQIPKFFFGFMILILSGCALFVDNREPPKSFGPREQVFYSNFDQVWRAAQISLNRYPIRINNLDLGIIETDTVKGYKAWLPPTNQKTSGGLSYRLSIRVVKGGVEGRPAIRVSISKDLEFQKDFFAESQKLPSDGLEEQSILYRMGRELQIDQALKKAQDKKNKQSQKTSQITL